MPVPLSTMIEQVPAVKKILLDPTVGHQEAADRITALGDRTSETSVRRWRAANDWQRTEDEAVAATPGGLPHAEEDLDGVTVYHDAFPVQLDEDLGPLLEFFGYNPANFYVVDDSVKMGKWQQSKGREDGGRDVIWLYSYKARFEKIKTPINEVDDLPEILSSIKAYKPARRSPGATILSPVTYVHQQGDEQIGKSEGGGLTGVTERSFDALQDSYDRLKFLLKTHPNIEGILDAASGDTVENIFGHYPSQQRTTDTLRKQFKAGRDLDIVRTKTLAEFGLPIKKAYTTDNHGEIRQAIGQAPYTSESDNLTLILAESVRDVLEQSTIADQIEWHIPHDEWWTLLTVSGVNVAHGHGHKVKGLLEKWVREQRDYLLFHNDFKAHLALLGHKHHFRAQDVSGTTMIQTPSLDGGSPYFEAMSGQRTRHGIVTFLAGAHFNQYFSDLVVL